MSPLIQFDKFDRKMETLIRELVLRIVVPSWSEFEHVWESANQVCDRYELTKAA